MAKLFFALSTLSFLCCVTFATNDIIDITIPNSEWDGAKSMLCTAYPVQANRFIKMFYPLHRMETVKHISAVLCETPYSTEKYWECPTSDQMCGHGKVVNLWAMAKDGPAWYLPEGFAVSTGSKGGYIMIQIHMPIGMGLESTPEFFASGLRLNITDDKPEYFSGLAVYGNVGYIPANTTDFVADAACPWPYDNNPVFGFTPHSHTMATAVSGYIYRNGEFIELVRADPVYPEAILDISYRKLELKKGDTIVVRCTLTNPTDKIAKFGFEHKDEMCDMYLYYGIPAADYDSYEEVSCAKDAQTFHLNNTIMPKDSTLPDKEGYAKLIAPYHLKKSKY